MGLVVVGVGCAALKALDRCVGRGGLVHVMYRRVREELAVDGGGRGAGGRAAHDVVVGCVGRGNDS